MTEESGDRVSKLLPYKSSKIRSRSYVKDDDLQIQVPQTQEAVHAENIETFKNIYAHYSRLVGQTPGIKSSEKHPNILDEVKQELDQAKLTYDMMMDISHSISEAYKDLKKLQ